MNACALCRHAIWIVEADHEVDAVPTAGECQPNPQLPPARITPARRTCAFFELMSEEEDETVMDSPGDRADDMDPDATWAGVQKRRRR